MIQLIEYINLQDCVSEKYITPCDKNGKFDSKQLWIKLVIYYWKDNKKPDCFNLPTSKFGVSCTKSCPKGYYIYLGGNEPECRICEENTFSLGGAIRFSGDLGEWDTNSLNGFGNSCSEYDYVTNKWVENKSCKGYTVNQDRSAISAGRKFNKNDTTYYFELTYGIHLKKQGNVNFMI